MKITIGSDKGASSGDVETHVLMHHQPDGRLVLLATMDRDEARHMALQMVRACLPEVVATVRFQATCIVPGSAPPGALWDMNHSSCAILAELESWAG